MNHECTLISLFPAGILQRRDRRFAFAGRDLRKHGHDAKEALGAVVGSSVQERSILAQVCKPVLGNQSVLTPAVRTVRSSHLLGNATNNERPSPLKLGCFEH